MKNFKKEKLFSLNDYYVFDSKILNTAEEYIKEFSKDFEKDMDANEHTDLGMISLVVFPMLKQLESYYNEEICVSAGLVLSLIETDDVSLRIKSYHAENLIFRLSSIWDYYYNIINEYLHLEIPADNIIKNEIINRYCANVDFVKKGKVTEVVEKPLPIEEQKRIRNELQKKIKVLGKSILINTIKHKFDLTDRFKKILSIIDSDCIEELKHVRNQIIHRRALGAGISADYSFLGQSISINNNGWCDFKELSTIIKENLKIISEAIRLIHEVIFLDERPNSLENKDKQYFVIKVKCKACGKESILPEMKTIKEENIPCPVCWKHGVEIIDKFKTNELNYGDRMYKHVNSFIKHVDKINGK
jgi:ribosomal protein L44E